MTATKPSCAHYLRKSGLTAIATEFEKDHTSVIYAVQKVAHNPRLDDATARILGALDARYSQAPPDAGTAQNSSVDAGIAKPAPSSLLQSAALRASMSRPDAAELSSKPDTAALTAPLAACF